MSDIISAFVFWIQDQPTFKEPKDDKRYTQIIVQWFSSAVQFLDQKQHPGSSLISFHTPKWTRLWSLHHTVEHTLPNMAGGRLFQFIMFPPTVFVFVVMIWEV